mmetsp:Transcript_4321/g.10545  ORF Transcript_4321/g.10545 Transcript_4321/m.10545 type:complete len:262 (-) Transcript_4321:7-792(-)
MWNPGYWVANDQLVLLVPHDRAITEFLQAAGDEGPVHLESSMLLLNRRERLAGRWLNEPVFRVRQKSDVPATVGGLRRRSCARRRPTSSCTAGGFNPRLVVNQNAGAQTGQIQPHARNSVDTGSGHNHLLALAVRLRLRLRRAAWNYKLPLLYRTFSFRMGRCTRRHQDLALDKTGHPRGVVAEHRVQPLTPKLLVKAKRLSVAETLHSFSDRCVVRRISRPIDVLKTFFWKINWPSSSVWSHAGLGPGPNYICSCDWKLT